jgi:hypothetical protein
VLYKAFGDKRVNDRLSPHGGPYTLVLSKYLEDRGRKNFKGIPLGWSWRMLLHKINIYS